MAMLNGVLPEEIRVLSWAPVSPDFSARFSCLQRTYKYFFPLGTMDIEVCVHVCVMYVCVWHVQVCVCACASVCVCMCKCVCKCVCVHVHVLCVHV